MWVCCTTYIWVCCMSGKVCCLSHKVCCMSYMWVYCMSHIWVCCMTHIVHYCIACLTIVCCMSHAWLAYSSVFTLSPMTQWFRNFSAVDEMLSGWSWPLPPRSWSPSLTSRVPGCSLWPGIVRGRHRADSEMHTQARIDEQLSMRSECSRPLPTTAALSLCEVHVVAAYVEGGCDGVGPYHIWGLSACRQLPISCDGITCDESIIRLRLVEIWDCKY